MINATKYINNDIFYTKFKKHYCPSCDTRLQRIKTSKTVNSNSPEAKDYDFSSAEGFWVGDVKFVFNEFYCPKCNKRISVEEMRRIEKVQMKRK